MTKITQNEQTVNVLAGSKKCDTSLISSFQNHLSAFKQLAKQPLLFGRCVFVILIFLISTGLNAQPVKQPVNPEKPNFFEIQKAFNEKYKDRVEGDETEGPKDDEYEKFKRWEWYWETRINPDGSFPSATKTYDEWAKYLETHPEAGKFAPAAPACDGNWVAKGPSSSKDGYTGLGRVNCIAFHPFKADSFWVGTPAGGLWVTGNNGATWKTKTDNMPVLGISDIAINPVHPDTMYIATGDGDFGSLTSMTAGADGDTKSIGVYKSTNQGNTWSATGLNWQVTTPKLIRRLIINPVNTRVLLAAASDGIWRTTNAGTNWTKVVTGYFIDIEFKPGDPNTVYASTFGADAQIFLSTNGGQTWSLISTFPYVVRINLEVTPANPSVVSAVCAGTDRALDGIWRSVNSGVTYAQILVGDTVSKNYLSNRSNGSGPGGQGEYDLAYCISPKNASNVWLGGISTWNSMNSGIDGWTIKSIWSTTYATPIPLPPGLAEVHGDKHCLVFHPLRPDTLYECNDGGLYRTTDGGTTWKNLSNGLQISQLYRIGVSQTINDDVLCGLQDNSIKEFYNNAWIDTLQAGDGFECIIDYTTALVSYACGNQNIYRSDDGGYNWTYKVSTGGAWVSPYVIHPKNPSTLYYGAKRIFRSTNKGNTWTSISQLLTSDNIRSIAISPSAPDTIYVATFNTFYKTTDGGANWTPVTMPSGVAFPIITYLAVHPNNPQTIWMTLGGYNDTNKVYKSINGGASWTNISGTLPNLPVNCFTYQTGGGMYIGTDVGVFYRDSLMADWKAYKNGLPNVVVTEMEIANSNKKLWAGTFGRGLWSTDLVLTVNAAVTNVKCKGAKNGTISITPSAGKSPYTYLWNDANTKANRTGLGPATYTVTVTDANTCTVSKVITITQPATALSVSITKVNVKCNGACTATATAVPAGGWPPYTYLWSNTKTTATTTGLCAGTYTVTCTDSSGCTATISSTITEPAKIAMTAVIDPNTKCAAPCNGKITLTVTGGSGAKTYLWNSGSTAKNRINLCAGNYTVTVTDTSGCTKDSMFVVPGNLATVTCTTTVIYNTNCSGPCNGIITANPANGTAPYSYLWSNAKTTQSATGLCAGAYTVTVTDVNGCSAIATANMTNQGNTLLLQGSGTPNNGCGAGCNGTLTVVVGGGTLPYTYNWSNGKTTQSVSNVCSGPYTITVTDNNGCTASAYASVGNNVGIISFTSTFFNNTSCVLPCNGYASVTASGGIDPYTYLWNTGNTYQSLNNICGGTYTVTATDANSCTASYIIAILNTINPPSVGSIAYNNSACGINCNGSITASPYNGTPPYNFVWSNGNTNISIVGLCAGTYTVTVFDFYGCAASITNTLINNSLPISMTGFVNNNQVCNPPCNGSIILSATGGSGGYSYVWSNGNSSQSPVGLCGGTYSVTVTDSSGCTGNGTFILSDDTSGCCSAVITPSGPTTFCPGGSVTLNATGGTNYFWSNGSTTSSIIVTTAGTYTVTTTSGLCTATATVSVSTICIPPVFWYSDTVTSTTAKLNWITQPCGIGYNVQYRIIGAPVFTNAPAINSNIGNTLLTGLAPLTSYEWRVRTRCQAVPLIASPYTATITFTTGGTASGPSKMSPPDEQNDVELFPNPTTDKFVLKATLKDGIYKIAVDDMFGRKVRQYIITVESNYFEKEIDLTGYDAGVYMLSVNGINTIIVKRIIKQ